MAAGTGMRLLGMDHGTICFPAGGRGCPGLAHLPSLLGQKWNSLRVEEAVEASQLIPNSHMLPRSLPITLHSVFSPLLSLPTLYITQSFLLHPKLLSPAPRAGCGEGAEGRGLLLSCLWLVV